MIYLILLTIYLLSVYINYKWMQKAYFHKNGKWKNTIPTQVDIYLVFCPILNTFIAIENLLVNSPYSNKKINKTNFFKPKNYDKNP